MKTTFATTGKSRLLTGAGFAALSIAAFASPALAQDAECVDTDGTVCVDEAVDATGTAESAPLIIVSGSRIARPNLDSPVPVTTVEAGELLNDGALSLGDALNDLPSLRSTFSSSNSQRFIGTTGLSILDLRGLGTSRTLTLVNGRRHVTASAGDFQVDVNTIPFELLERVDVVTGGSSAVYGSDAIAGVVNFVLKRDFDGIEISGQAGLSSRGDNGRYSISGLYGKNFADGRGNIALVAEYSKIESVLNSQRPKNSGFGIGFTGFETVDSDAGVRSNADGIPDTELRNNLFIDFISEGGTVFTGCYSSQGLQPAFCDANGNDRRGRFDNTGRLTFDANTPFPSGLAVGGGGSSLSDGSLIPDIERININVLGHFDVSDAFRPYAEFKYARIEALGQGTPSFFNSFCGPGTFSQVVGVDPSCTQGLTSSPFFISFDNAFLHPADAAIIAQDHNNILAAVGNPNPSQGFFLNRNNSDFGTRNDSLKRETYRIVAGVEGDLSSNTRYDVSFTYGKFTSNLTATNNLIYQNARNAVDSILVGGVPTCRINADASTANDDAACVPLNVLGAGAPSAAALAYVNTVAELNEEAEQFDLLGYISTDSSNFFELPGGPISLVLGGEWRRETAFSQPDAFSATGATFFNAFDVFDPPALEVMEAFGEISLPILANVPFFEELTVSGAGRVSDYNSGAGLTGTVYAYNGNLLWSPITDLRLRANYSRAVRSPTLSNLFASQSVNFLFFDDPCDIDNINFGTGNRTANCAADGVPTGYDDVSTGSRAVLQGGNERLAAETSDSYTIGGIFEPSFVPGFTLSVDYYNIEVKNVIANVSAQQIVNNCYDGADLNSSFCRQINPRQPGGGFDSNSALILGPINFAKLTAEGIDFDARYVKTFDNDDRLSLRLIATHVLDRTNFLDVDTPDLPNIVKGELGDPEWAANFNASYRRGDVTLSYSLRFVDKQFIGSAENYISSIQACDSTGRVPRTEDICVPGELVTAPPLNPDFTAEVYYPKAFYHDIRVDFRIEDEFLFYFGVDNVGDRQPSFGLTGGGGGSGIFNNTGRYFYAGFTAEF